MVKGWVTDGPLISYWRILVSKIASVLWMWMQSGSKEKHEEQEHQQVDSQDSIFFCKVSIVSWYAIYFV